MATKYISKEKLKVWQDRTSFLERYVNNDNVRITIGPNINTVEVKETNLLFELGQINRRREEIIKELSK